MFICRPNQKVAEKTEYGKKFRRRFDENRGNSSDNVVCTYVLNIF
jgi:hypothetical protein